MRRKGRKMGGHREPNGRLSRRTIHVREREEMTIREAQSTVIAARMRHTGLPEGACSVNDAGRPNAGTVHGVMCLQGELSRPQWDAAEWYIGKRAAWLRAIDAPGQATGSSSSGTIDEDRHAEFCAQAIRSWQAAIDCIQSASTEVRTPLAAALDVILVRQQQVGHMIGDLRVALNAIHRRFLG